jgi:hypothetical protein
MFQVQPVDPQGNLRSDASFHPKFFLLKYTAEDGQGEYRLVITSRNLTTDRSMDIIALMRLHEQGAKTEAGGKLSTFIEAVLLQQPPKRRTLPALERLVSEIKSLAIRPFDEEEYLYPDSFDFHFQIGGQTNTATGMPHLKSILKAPSASRTVISPFVDLSTLKNLFPETAEHASTSNLLSRPDQLDKICSTLEGVTFLQSIQCWVPKVIDASLQAYEGIHAKLILDPSADKTQVLLGSANATWRAWEGNNWEIMLSLQTDTEFFKHFSADWFGVGLDTKSKSQPLAERYNPVLIKIEQKDDPVEAWRNSLSCAQLTSVVTCLNETVYTSITLIFDNPPSELSAVTLKLRPISLEHDYFQATLTGEHSFSCQYDTLIRIFTCFLEINVYNGADFVCSVVRLLEDVPDLLLEERNTYAIRDEVERQGLFRYLEGIIGHITPGGNGGGGGAGDGDSLLGNLPEFVNLESLYTACLRDPAKAREVDRVLMSPPDKFSATEAGANVRNVLIPLQVIWSEVRNEIFPSSF